MQRAFMIGYAKGLHESGCSDLTIAEKLDIPRSTVGRWRRCDFSFRRRKGSGRAKKTTTRGDRLIHRLACKNATVSSAEIAAQLGNVSKWTVRRRLKKAGLRNIKRPSAIPHTDRHLACRLEWAMRHCLWRSPQWNKVIWSDEASVSLASKDGRLRLWVRSRARVLKALVSPSVQGGGGRILVWGAIWRGGRSPLHVTKETMTSERYIQVLQQYICPMVTQGDWRFMDDNAPPHTSHATRAFKQQVGVRTFAWPPRSPDLNPIENVWSWCKLRLRKRLRQEDTLQTVEQHFVELWNEMPQNLIDVLIDSMTKRVGEVIRNRGELTHY